MKKMKLFTVDFEPVWGVPCALVILAYDIDEARGIAEETIKHPQSVPIQIMEHDMNKPGVVIYESGDY